MSGLKSYTPTGTAYGVLVTKAFDDGAPTTPASEDFRVDIVRAGVRHRACQASRGTVDTRPKATAFHGQQGDGSPITKAAVDGAALDLPAGTILADDWGIYLVSRDDAGDYTTTAGAGNFDGSYANEAAAIVGLPSTPAGEQRVFAYTVQTASAQAFVGNTDALAGGSSGNPAATTNFYTFAEQLASDSPAGALTYNEDAFATGSHDLFADVADMGGAADASGSDEVFARLTAGTVDAVSVVGDLVLQFGVAIDGLTTGVKNDVNAEADTAISDASLDDLVAAMMPVNTTIATLSSQTSFTLTAGSADNDAYNGWVAVIRDAATATQYAVGMVQDYVGSSKTVTLATDPGIFTMAATDLIRLLPPSVLLGVRHHQVNLGIGTTADPWRSA